MTYSVQNECMTGTVFEGKQRTAKQFLNCQLLIFAFLMVAGLCTVPGQDEKDPIRIDTDLVEFEVLVEDKDGNPVHGMKPGDFRVFEDGVARRIDFFQPVRASGKTRPLAIVFAVDVSGSMTPTELEKLKSAILRFIERFGDHESYFSLVSFAMDVRKIQSFTNRPDLVRRSLDKLGRDQDGLSTHAFDGIDTAVRMIEKDSPRSLRGRAPKRAIIAITDGFPVGDTVGPATVIERANRAGVSVYSIILPSFSPIQRDKRPLLTILEASGIVEKTGGKSLYAVSDNIEPIFESLAEEITGSYVIAFYPDESKAARSGNRVVRIESTRGLKIKQNRTSYELRK